MPNVSFQFQMVFVGGGFLTARAGVFLDGGYSIYNEIPYGEWLYALDQLSTVDADAFPPVIIAGTQWEDMYGGLWVADADYVLLEAAWTLDGFGGADSGRGYSITGQANYVVRGRKAIPSREYFPPQSYIRPGDDGDYAAVGNMPTPIWEGQAWSEVGFLNTIASYVMFRHGYWWLMLPSNPATYPYILYSETTSGIGAGVNLPDWSINETQPPFTAAKQALSDAGFVWRLQDINYYYQELQVLTDGFGPYEDRPGYYRKRKHYPPSIVDDVFDPVPIGEIDNKALVPDTAFGDLQRRWMI